MNTVFTVEGSRMMFAGTLSSAPTGALASQQRSSNRKVQRIARYYSVANAMLEFAA
jgi:hypothetical protein